jgi:hypothetical protein
MERFLKLSLFGFLIMVGEDLPKLPDYFQVKIALGKCPGVVENGLELTVREQEAFLHVGEGYFTLRGVDYKCDERTNFDLNPPVKTLTCRNSQNPQ